MIAHQREVPDRKTLASPLIDMAVSGGFVVGVGGFVVGVGGFVVGVITLCVSQRDPANDS